MATPLEKQIEEENKRLEFIGAELDELTGRKATGFLSRKKPKGGFLNIVKIKTLGAEENTLLATQKSRQEKLEKEAAERLRLKGKKARTGTILTTSESRRAGANIFRPFATSPLGAERQGAALLG